MSNIYWFISIQQISLLYSTKSRLLHVCRAHAGSVDILETSEGKIEPYGSRTDGVIGDYIHTHYIATCYIMRILYSGYTHVFHKCTVY